MDGGWPSVFSLSVNSSILFSSDRIHVQTLISEYIIAMYFSVECIVFLKILLLHSFQTFMQNSSKKYILEEFKTFLKINFNKKYRIVRHNEKL